MKYLCISVICFLGMTSLVSCSNNFTEMDASDLRKRAHRCVIESNSTAAKLQVCENIKRECLRRQKAGQFDC